MRPDGINLLRIDEQFVDAADLVTKSCEHVRRPRSAGRPAWRPVAWNINRDECGWHRI